MVGGEEGMSSSMGDGDRRADLDGGLAMEDFFLVLGRDLRDSEVSGDDDIVDGWRCGGSLASRRSISIFSV